MPIDWVIAGKVALAAGQAFMDHLTEAGNDAARERDRELILAAVRRVQTEILERLNELEINELRGELEGFRLTYASYDPDPADPLEEGRLVSLIDDSARVLGRLGAHLDAVADDTTLALALEAWAVYVPLLYLRAQAMTERQVVYGAMERDEAVVSFDSALPRLRGVLTYIRAQSDKTFGPVTCRPHPDSEDPKVCWYKWGNERFICGSTRDPNGVAKCRASRTRNMDIAYRSSAGVKEITAAAEQLQLARDALTASPLRPTRPLGGIAVNITSKTAKRQTP